MSTTIVFDAYGTLFNLDALVAPATTILDDVAIAERVCTVWRSKHLEYAWTSLLMNRYQDFDKLSAFALDFALTNAGIQVDKGAKQKLLDAQRHLPLYDDVQPTLDALGSLNPLAILSNGTFRSLQSLTEKAGILFSFDYVLSVEPFRTYKPAREAYQLALDKLGGDKTGILFVSSNQWDIAGAKSFGFQTVWCNRKNVTYVPVGPNPDTVIRSLEELSTITMN